MTETAVNDAMVAVPEWTEYRKKSGLDPLGMQNSSVNLYQRLVPGISNVTLRVRYYGFYAWLASLYAKRSGSTDPKNWQRFVRRAEAIYALAAQYHGGEGGIAGIQWAQRALAAQPDGPIAFAANSDPGAEGTPYLRQAWGAYGAAYASQMFEIGAYIEVKDHSIPVTSQGLGEELAVSFGSSLTALEDRYHHVLEAGVATTADLDLFRVITPSEVGQDSEERGVYERMLFADGSNRKADISRRETLMLLLHCAAHLGQVPDVSSVRWLLYSGMDRHNAPLDLDDPQMKAQQRRWWTYQANDLLQLSYETLLKFCLESLAVYSDGATMLSLIAEVVSSISEAVGEWPHTWADFSASCAPTLNANADDDPMADRHLVATISRGLGAGKKTTAEAAWAALRIIGIVENRARSEMEVVRGELGLLNREGFHSLVTETAFLESLSPRSFSEAVANLVEQRIIKRHLWVAHRKLRYQGDYTFLLESDNGRVRQRADSGPVLTNPRLGPALTFLRDIHLLDASGITLRGLKRLGRA